MSEKSSEKAFYSRQELQEFEDIINKKLASAREEHQILADNLKESGGGSADSYNFTEFGGDSREKEQNEMLMARQKKFIFDLENALVRIKNGTYGICKVTGKLISKERLRIVPHTTTSIEAKLKQKNLPKNR